MSAVRVLVTGASGQVGVDLVDVLRGVQPPGSDPSWQPDGRRVDDGEFEVLALSHHDLDVADGESVRRALTMSRPDVVVNLAAYTAVDRAEGEPEACQSINSSAVALLSNESNKAGAHFVTISTDYVFNGRKGEAYVESDATDPLNVYGRTKLDGERHCSPSDTIVRTSWVLGTRGKNVVGLIIERSAANQPIRFVDDQRGSPTFGADLARALVTLVRQRPGGVWHFANEGNATWFDLASATVSLVSGAAQNVQAITTSQLDPAPRAVRPARSDLATAKWEHGGWSAPLPWLDGLRRFVDAR